MPLIHTSDAALYLSTMPDMLFHEQLIVIRGAGDLATGVALRLHRAGFPVVILDTEASSTPVGFGWAVQQGAVTIAGVEAQLVTTPVQARTFAPKGIVAVLTDLDGSHLRRLRPSVLVDARPDGTVRDTTISSARLVIGIGPGFTVGQDVHAVIETAPGPDLGRVLWKHGPQATHDAVAGEENAPITETERCCISDDALMIGGGVVEAVLTRMSANKQRHKNEEGG